MARTLLLVRHGAIAPEYAGRYIGSTDLPLGSPGLVQVQGMCAPIAARRPGECFCSPLVRAYQTAEPIAHAAGIPVQFDADLREVDFGRWEAKTFPEISAEDPLAVDHWAELADDFCFPQGEGIADFLSRTHRAADRLASRAADVVLAVTHGGVIRSMICHLLGLEAKHYILFNVRCGACVTIDLYDGKGVLAGLDNPPTAEGA